MKAFLNKFHFFFMPALVFSARLGGILLGLVTNIILARHLSMSDFGLVVTATSIAFLAAIPMTAGVEASSARYMIQSLARGEKERAAGYVRYGQLTFLVMAPLSLLVIVGALYGVAWLRGESVNALLVIGVCVAPLFGIIRLLSSIGRGFSLVLAPNIARTLFRPAFYGVAVGTVVLLLGAHDPFSIMMAFLASLCATTLAQYLLIQPHFSQLRGVRPDLTERREWLFVGIQLSFAAIFIEYSSNFVVVISAINISSSDVAIFSIAATIAGLASFAILSVDQVLTPQLSRSIANNNSARVRRLLALTTQIKVWGTFLGVILVYLFGEYALGLFGKRYLDAEPVLEILMFQACAQALLGPGYLYLSLARHQQVIVIASVMALAYTCGAVFLASAYGSIETVAWVVVSAWTGLGLALSIITFRRHGIDLTFIGSCRYFVTHARRPPDPT